MASLSRRTLLRAVGVTGAVGLAGCVGNSGVLDTGGPDQGGGSPTTASEDAAGSPTGTTAAGTTTTSTGDPPPNPPTADTPLSVDYHFSLLRSHVQSGGPPKDGIPSIDRPKFVDAAKGDEFLDSDDVVFGVAGDSDVKAYPQSILVWHEIVNDTIDRHPVSVTYCPLTGTALGFDRGNTTFGTSGNLLNNNLVMYDRNSDSRWPQILATAIEGPFEGRSLREFRLVWTTWQQWKRLHPETVVLSEKTGFARNYDRDPYGSYTPKRGYYASDNTLFPTLRDDDRYAPKDIVMGARRPEGSIAFHKGSLAEAGVLDGKLGDQTYTAVYDDRLDTAYVYHNPDEVAVSLEGATATADGESYEPDALPLQQVHAFDAMWFAWSGFYRDTVVVE